MQKYMYFIIASLVLLLIAVGFVFARQQRPLPEMKPLTNFENLYSAKPLGCTVENKRTTFRVFAPRASSVTLVVFGTYETAFGDGKEYFMKRDNDGVWEYTLNQILTGKYYGYKVAAPKAITEDPSEMFDGDLLIADPYSKAVVTQNNFRHPARTLIIDDAYDWQNDSWVIPENHNELIIYEAHLRDLTAHATSGVSAKGTYKGLTEQGKAGGLSYLKDLGITAVEFLPLQKFGTIELPYKDSSIAKQGMPYNTWNPYERNHWGYMTSFFFAPETYYATNGNMIRGQFNGKDALAVTELKDLVKALHKEKIAVIMDVVYNHVSQYDYNPYKYIDKKYYFQIDDNGNFKGESGCGNDFKTDRLMSRRMIVESIKYWMTHYHIDGFRFDLAAMIDSVTGKEILAEAKRINPNVILIAEPWGGGKYSPDGFSVIGWSAWNDQFRNGVKGQNPYDGQGFIFGKNQGGNTKKSLMNYTAGTLKVDGGLFQRKEHAINYLESHDDNTLGDFIRLATGVQENGSHTADEMAVLTPRQLELNKLAAMYLLTAQGPVMIHEGQEFARSKVIAPTAAKDAKTGQIDHNSYEKDDATNWLNYSHKSLNIDLYDYYKHLIEIRRTYPKAFGSADKAGLTYFDTRDNFSLAYKIDKNVSHEVGDFIVAMNGNAETPVMVKLPAGAWRVLVSGKPISPSAAEHGISGNLVLPPCTGVVLMQ
jgi:pullulanase